MQPIMTFDKKDRNDTTNFVGYHVIRIYALNYDGKGSGLVTFEGGDVFEILDAESMTAVLCGDQETGHRWYKERDEKDFFTRASRYCESTTDLQTLGLEIFNEIARRKLAGIA